MSSTVLDKNNSNKQFFIPFQVETFITCSVDDENETSSLYMTTTTNATTTTASTSHTKKENDLPSVSIHNANDSMHVATKTTTATFDASQTKQSTKKLNTNNNTNDMHHHHYHHHLVVPTDTLAGLCLHYKVSKQALQRANPGKSVASSVDGCRLAVQPGDRLLIPLEPREPKGTTRTKTAAAAAVVRQDVNTPAYKTAAVLEQCRYLTVTQAESFLSRNHWNVNHAVQQAKVVRQQQHREEVRVKQAQRQRKQDAVQIQRILLEQQQKQQQQTLQAQCQEQSTELTRLTKNDNSNLYLDQPDDNEKHENNNKCNCVGACCSLACLVLFEWIRHSLVVVPFGQ